MKKLRLFIIFLLAFCLSPAAYANMAPAKTPDIASSITFERNDAIAVLSEVLDITVKSPMASIVAAYRMKNTENESISVRSMFLSPNIERSGVKVKINSSDAPFTFERYSLYDSEIGTDDWKYVLLSPSQPEKDDERTIDAVNFTMDFEPYEEYEVIVSYEYCLGGFALNDIYGEIEYYLSPASLWKDFSGLTVNLHLEKGMPSITSSTLEFKKIGARTYQYVSDTLPEANLKIVISESWFQNIIRELRIPYRFLNLFILFLYISPYLLLAFAILYPTFLIVRKARRAKRIRRK